MKSTGIIRRIDDLGRIVIPKEIRRTIRLREGDPMEIFLNDGGVVFKKYSPMAELSHMAKTFCYELGRTINGRFIVTDKDDIVASTFTAHRDIMDNLRSTIDNVINKRYTHNDSFEGIGSVVITPIVSSGELVGTIIAIVDGAFNEHEINIIEYTARLMGKEIED